MAGQEGLVDALTQRLDRDGDEKDEGQGANDAPVPIRKLALRDIFVALAFEINLLVDGAVKAGL